MRNARIGHTWLRGCAMALGFTAVCAPASAAAPPCPDNPSALGVSRVVEIDTRTGPLYGRITHFNRQKRFLKPKEVVLTFDDGPSPRHTSAVLRALAHHCTRATFFPVGERAIKFPRTMRAIAEAGHTIGSHTFSHPYNMGRMPPGRARDEIERGFAATALSVGAPIAPFFRFTGLSDDRSLLGYTQSRKIAVFSVDVVSDDSYTSDVARLVAQTLRRTRAQNGGILLFHDIKSVTQRALPHILSGLQREGFQVVHIVPATAFRRDPNYDSIFQSSLDRRLGKAASNSKAAPIAARKAAAEPGAQSALKGTIAPTDDVSAPTQTGPTTQTQAKAPARKVGPRVQVPQVLVYPADPRLAGVPRTTIRPNQGPFDPDGDRDSARAQQPAAQGQLEKKPPVTGQDEQQG